LTDLETPPAPPAIDPRIKARRVAVWREEGRRRRSRLYRLAALFGILAAGALATRTPLLDVDRVEVEGAARSTREAVVAASGLSLGTPMIEVDGEGVEQAVLDLPWVAAVEVNRRWPSTVRIKVVEREPAAVVPAAGGAWATVDATGRVLEVRPAPPSGLLQVLDAGRAGRPATRVGRAARDLLDVVDAVPYTIVGPVVAVAAVGDGEAELRLSGGTVMRLGPPDDLPAKLLAAATVLEQVDLACVALVDLRVPVTPALTHRPGCA
jgi:cell division protein FtsQ